MPYQFESMHLPPRDQMEAAGDGRVVVPVEMVMKDGAAEAGITVRVTVADSGNEDQMHADAVHAAEDALGAAAQHLEDNDARNLSWFVQGE
jgi:hypothetical protein